MANAKLIWNAVMFLRIAGVVCLVIAVAAASFRHAEVAGIGDEKVVDAAR